MRTNILLILTAVFTIQFTSAQVLLDDHFDNYTLGNLGTDITGVIPGQGNWLTNIPFPLASNNSAFTITNETSKGKVLTFTAQQYDAITATKDLSTFMSQRTTGNNVIKFEIDYYTGTQYNIPDRGVPSTAISLLSNNNGVPLIRFHNHLLQYNYIQGYVSDGSGGANGFIEINNTNPTLPDDTWVSFIVYLDYNNKKIYCEIPYFNKVAVGNFLDLSTSTNLIEDFKPSSIILSSDAYIFNSPQMVHKFDNIKVTALKDVPPNILSINEQLATKFNIFPNPANNVVTITNSENIGVEQVQVFDISGKIVQSHIFNNENQVQLNIENLASGSYLLHIKTNEGTAMKKLVKQ